MSDTPYHIPVMLNETLEHLITTSDGIYVDGTLGGGGHAEKICERLNNDGTLIGIDADTDAIQEAGKRLQRFQSKIQLVNENTAHIATILRSQNISTISQNNFCISLAILLCMASSKAEAKTPSNEPYSVIRW